MKETIAWVYSDEATHHLLRSDRILLIQELNKLGYGVAIYDSTSEEYATQLLANVKRHCDGEWPKIIIWEGGLSLLKNVLELTRKMKIPVLEVKGIPYSNDGISIKNRFNEITNVIVQTRIWKFPEKELEDTKQD